MMTGRERARLAERGFDVPDGDEGMRRLRDSGGTYRCPALDAAGRCGAYDVRPLVCRLYGSTPEVETLRCSFGCGQLDPVSEADARVLVADVERIAGAPY